MIKEEFNQHWATNYSDTPLIPHHFRHRYADRWFRIHSLPESQRYASTPEEWEILLSRHNQIITDLLGNHSKALLIAGDYNYNSPEDTHIVEEDPAFQAYAFTLLEHIDLHSLSPDEYEQGQVYRPAFAETIWSINQHDRLLKEIADFKLLAFFVSFEQNLIIAPYDGGIDFILKNSQLRDTYKAKYQDWLSKLPSGL